MVALRHLRSHRDLQEWAVLAQRGPVGSQRGEGVQVGAGNRTSLGGSRGSGAEKRVAVMEVRLKAKRITVYQSLGRAGRY